MVRADMKKLLKEKMREITVTIEKPTKASRVGVSLKSNDKTDGYVLVIGTTPEGAFDRAGIFLDDRIVCINSEHVRENIEGRTSPAYAAWEWAVASGPLVGFFPER